MAANQLRGAQALGYFPQPASTAMTTLALNATATWVAFSWVPTASKNANSVRVYMNPATGTIQNTDISCDIYSDTSGSPNASLGTTTAVSGVPANGASGWVTFTFSSPVSVTAGTQYWIVLKNPSTASASPATVYPTYSYGNQGTGPVTTEGILSGYGWSKKHTTTSGGSWITALAGSVGWRIGYNDSTYDGLPIQALGGGADKIFGNTEVGNKFTTPGDASFNVIGICGNVGKTGAGSPLYFNLYSGTTLLASTATIANAVIGAGSYLTAYFSSDVVLQPSTTYRYTASQGAGGSASIYYTQNVEITVDSDSNSLALLPFATTGAVAKTIWNGSSFTDTASAFFPFALLLDSNNELNAFAAGLFWEG